MVLMIGCEFVSLWLICFLALSPPGLFAPGFFASWLVHPRTLYDLPPLDKGNWTSKFISDICL